MRNEYLRKVRSLRRDGLFVFLLYWAYPRGGGGGGGGEKGVGGGGGWGGGRKKKKKKSVVGWAAPRGGRRGYAQYSRKTKNPSHRSERIFRRYSLRIRSAEADGNTHIL